jgi:hypothetical protein
MIHPFERAVRGLVLLGVAFYGQWAMTKVNSRLSALNRDMEKFNRRLENRFREQERTFVEANGKSHEGRHRDNQDSH